ncbi:MAG: SDR family oxidoreductase [Gluconacetobacter diazotrophicus]|nr:SDR family oxidoreductase [Gluconacetobacter diazotrophicus]
MARSWFITGTSSGFGRILTEEALAAGDRVVATLRRPGALDDLKDAHGDRLDVVELEVSDMTAVRRAVDAAFASGRIDVVVSNAGYGLGGAAEEVSDEQVRAQVDTNLLGSIQVIRAALPHLRAQGGGRVVQLSSEGGLISYPFFSLYHATKWGIEGFVEAVAQEVASFGIEFTLVEPSATNTNFATTSLNTAAPMPEYADTPVGHVRRAISGAETKWEFDDPRWMVRAIVASVGESPAPRRMPMGIGTYERVRDGLRERLEQVEAEADRSRGIGYRDGPS